ncbi:hypothetical protein [Kitasatospora sp. NPDC015120]|uniref:hypothetical protein n=1 Tax=Kitasatospora sp. NPDC015120 TaxID=3364023 RepID=UPI0036F4645F
MVPVGASGRSNLRNRACGAGESEVDRSEALYAPIEVGAGELDAFKCASRNEGHTTMTEELGEWIVNEINTNG